MRFRTFALVVTGLALVVVVRRTWFGVRPADARVEIVESPRTTRVLAEVLDAARRPLPSSEELDEPETEPETEPALEIESDELLDEDGLTVAQRWDGSVAELEDRLAPGLGAIQGRVRDAYDLEDLPGVTIVARSPALVGEQVVIADEHGFYVIKDLPAGVYQLTFYYLDTTVERSGLEIVSRRATAAFQKLDTEPSRGEVFVMRTEDSEDAEAPDPLDEPYTDGLGVSFVGVTSIENTYVIE